MLEPNPHTKQVLVQHESRRVTQMWATRE
jgi:hypothetical protein